MTSFLFWQDLSDTKKTLTKQFGKMTDCTILLQGRINDECLKLWIENHSDKKVILSIWNDEEIWKYNIPSEWEIYVNQYPLVRFWEHANLDYQLITTLTGLNAVTTKYVIKMRCDEYWSNLENIYNRVLLNDKKIVTGSVFFREWGMYQFHCSDKILAGTTENIKSMFTKTVDNIVKKVWDVKIPECQLGLGWIMVNEPEFDTKKLYPQSEIDFDYEAAVRGVSRGLEIVMADIKDILSRQFNPHYTNRINFSLISDTLIRDKDILVTCCQLVHKENEIKAVDDKPLMRKWFDIIDVNELKPYIATQNVGQKRKWFRSDFDHNEEKCLTDINNN